MACRCGMTACACQSTFSSRPQRFVEAVWPDVNPTGPHDAPPITYGVHVTPPSVHYPGKVTRMVVNDEPWMRVPRCDGCKWWTPRTGECGQPDVNGHAYCAYEVNTPADFGCTKWEAK